MPQVTGLLGAIASLENPIEVVNCPREAHEETKTKISTVERIPATNQHWYIPFPHNFNFTPFAAEKSQHRCEAVCDVRNSGSDIANVKQRRRRGDNLGVSKTAGSLFHRLLMNLPSHITIPFNLTSAIAPYAILT